MTVTRRNVRVTERMGVRTRDAILNAVTFAELAADIERHLKDHPIDLGKVSDGLHSMVLAAAAKLEPADSKKVLDDIYSRMQGTSTAGNGSSFSAAMSMTDAMRRVQAMREMRDATCAKGMNKTNAEFYDKLRGG